MFRTLLLISSAVCAIASQVDGCIGRAGYQAEGANVDANTRNAEVLKAKMTPGMKVKSIKGCKSTGIIRMLEVVLTDPATAEQLELGEVGPVRSLDQCSKLKLDDDEFIKSIEVTYVRNYIRKVGVTTTSGNFMSWGSGQLGSSTKRWEFDDYEFIGFYGTENASNIQNLGPIAFDTPGYPQCWVGYEEQGEETEQDTAGGAGEGSGDATDPQAGEGQGESEAESTTEQLENPSDSQEAAAGSEQEGSAPEQGSDQGATGTQELKSTEVKEDSGNPVALIAICLIILLIIIVVIIIVAVVRKRKQNEQPKEAKKTEPKAEPVSKQDEPSVLSDGAKGPQTQSAVNGDEWDKTENLDDLEASANKI